MSKDTKQVVLSIRFKIKPGMKDTFQESLFDLINNFRSEPAFVNAIVSNDTDNPNDLHIYEVWQGTRQSWLEEELPKPYRQKYEDRLSALIDDRNVSWLEPIREWGKNDS